MDATTHPLHTNPYLNYPTSLIFFPETICRLLPTASFKTLSFQHKTSVIRAYATNGRDIPFSKKSFLGRASKEDGFTAHTSSNSRSSNRENLIALFKRIQIEISQGESGSRHYTSVSEPSIDDDASVETSVLEFLQQSNRKSNAESSKLKHSEEPNRERKTTKKENSIFIPQPSYIKKFTRPPSNFVRKSPIPSQTTIQGNEIEVNYREDSSSEANKGPSKIEGMKLSELKQLAKEWGIRGYSKLKKSDLIQLLKS